MASASRESTEEEWMLAKQGIELLINNKGKEAEEFFLKYPHSLMMFSGYSYVVFMDALMSFEEEKLTKAIDTLKEVEKKCNTQGWFSYMKSKMFGTSQNELSLVESLENQIILADSQVCLAILIFLQQDISGYLKAGWVLRKAWKVYQSTYNDILKLYNTHIGPLNLPDPILSAPGSCDYTLRTEDEILNSSEEKLNTKPTPCNGKITEKPLNKKVIIRLMNAVAFGYGLLQLGISLLPPGLLRLTSFLGLGGNRMHGLACLMYSRLGVDMRAPLATLSLLWYHCIIRPFFGFDGTNVGAGAQIATQLIKETSAIYGDSALFLFFKGRMFRLKSDIPEALCAFQAAVTNATQREIKLLALHEIGWCYLILLDFQNAEANFSYLSSTSRWSKPFYSYISCICKGSRIGFSEYSILDEFINSIRSSSRSNQLDEFLVKRTTFFSGKEDLSKCSNKFWTIFVYEMMYLWNSLASCTKENIQKIVQDCNLESPLDEPMKGVSKLIQGACFVILGQPAEAKSSLAKCIEIRKENFSNNTKCKDAHILAFAQYELGLMLYEAPETKAEGKKLLQEIGTIKDYDFEERLTVRVNSILKHS